MRTNIRKVKMLVANRQNIKKYARELLGVEHTPELAKEIIDICNKNNLSNYHDGRSHISFAMNWMSEINRVLHNFGVESIDLAKIIPDITILGNDRYVMYSNTGDSYALTIMWYNGKFRIGSPGDFIEKLAP